MWCLYLASPQLKDLKTIIIISRNTHSKLKFLSLTLIILLKYTRNSLPKIITKLNLNIDLCEENLFYGFVLNRPFRFTKKPPSWKHVQTIYSIFNSDVTYPKRCAQVAAHTSLCLSLQHAVDLVLPAAFDTVFCNGYKRRKFTKSQTEICSAAFIIMFRNRDLLASLGIGVMLWCIRRDIHNIIPDLGVYLGYLTNKQSCSSLSCFHIRFFHSPTRQNLTISAFICVILRFRLNRAQRSIL